MSAEEDIALRVAPADKRYDEEQGVMNDLRASDIRATQGVTSVSVSVSTS